MSDYFTLVWHPDPDSSDPKQLATAAPISCGLCGSVVSGMGGPDNGALCKSCAGVLMSGRLRGILKKD